MIPQDKPRAVGCLSCNNLQTLIPVLGTGSIRLSTFALHSQAGHLPVFASFKHPWSARLFQLSTHTDLLVFCYFSRRRLSVSSLQPLHSAPAYTKTPPGSFPHPFSSSQSPFYLHLFSSFLFTKILFITSPLSFRLGCRPLFPLFLFSHFQPNLDCSTYTSKPCWSN